VTPTLSAPSIGAHAVAAPERLRFVYRAEQAVAALALLLLLPLGGAIAVIVFLLSGRSPLIRHSRVGRRGATLALLKFRTMWDGTEPGSGFFAIEHISTRPATPLKSPHDVRVTSAFAAFCRRHSLDEIPQLFHVMRGEMSLVGPRPLTAEELRTWYGPAAATILELRPGLTGLWQVAGRSRLTYHQRRRLDLFLVRHAGMGLYFRILLRTMPKVFAATDAF